MRHLLFYSMPDVLAQNESDYRQTVVVFVLCLTQIGHSLLRRDGAVLHHHLHKVDQRLHDGDQCLSLLRVLVCNSKPESKFSTNVFLQLIGCHGVNVTTWCLTVGVMTMGL